jgi:hypothetical protein
VKKRRNKKMKEQIISQKLKLVPIVSIATATLNAGLDSDSVDMQGAKSVSFLCMFGPSYAGAAAVVKLYEGATHGTKTTALTFNYRYGGAAAGSATADVLSAIATSAALSIATATLAGRLLVIELNADQLTDGMRYLTLEIGAEADAGELTIVAVIDTMYLTPAGDTFID